jgi:Rho termination factor, N-terminal domain
MSSIKSALKQIADGFTALSEAVGDDWPPHVEVDVHVDGDKAKSAPKAEKEAAKSGLDRASLSKKTVAQLRKIAIQEGYDDEDVADADKDDLIDALASDDASDEDAEDDEDGDVEAEDLDTPDIEADEDAEDEGEDDEEEAGEDDEYTRDELEEMSMKELKDIAKEMGYTAADVRGKDVDALVDLLLGEDDSGEDSEDEADEDAEGEDDEDALTEDDLAEMSLEELKELAEEYEIELKPRMRKASIIDAILEG